MRSVPIPTALAATILPTVAGPVVRMDQVARLVQTEGPSTIQREWSRRRITVQCNVRGRDVAGFVAEAKDRIAAQVTFPEEYTVEWSGQFENMERANRRLKIIVPMALGLIFIMLYLSLGSVRDLLVVATGIPLGAVGGIGALAVRGLPFTVSAAIGFIALSGVAILNGLVLVTFIQQRLAAEVPLAQAVREGCRVRLRPVLMTALVAAVGFIPMAVNTGRRRRGSATAGDRRDRWNRQQHAAHARGPTHALHQFPTNTARQNRNVTGPRSRRDHPVEFAIVSLAN